MKALVYKSTGSWYLVKTPDGQPFQARIKGRFKIEAIQSTNPLAVGDEVEIEIENETENSVIITHIYDRHNYIARQSPSNKRQHHIIAANLDQSLLIATLRAPKTSAGFIDRFLVSAEAYHIPAIIVFNKTDLYREKEKNLLKEWTSIYTEAGYRVIAASMITGEGIADIKATLQNKTTLLSGHSGVGKSTFINTIYPELELKTSEVSEWSGKGLHTTTFAEMFDLPGGGKIIDTPGVREFGIIDIAKAELSHYFPEMRSRINDCQFNNCMHLNEPECAVKEAVIEGSIHENRYISYVTILDSIEDRNY